MSKQYASLTRYNSFQSSRLSKTVRAQLKKLRLLSSVWHHFLNLSQNDLNHLLDVVIKNAQKRLFKITSLINSPGVDYKISVLVKEQPKKEETLKEVASEVIPKNTKKEDVIKLIVEEQKVAKKEESKKQNKQEQWKPKENPSYTGFLDSFLNAASQKKVKQSKYIPPKSLPKPSNDW